ncbi:MAG: hypothetical protein GX649_12400 [Chloroflexi bacterium]|nr:hypothetical protein [Chloroflexota bacterium]
MAAREGDAATAALPSRRSWLLPLAAGTMLVAVLGLAYGYTLGLPLFLDDLVHFRWLEGRSLLDVWRSAEIIGYYRPLTFTLWQVLRRIQGWYHPAILHAVNLLLHGANALLLMALLWRRGGEGARLVGWTAGALFLLFPFSYQAVPWVGSLSHILATSLTLGALYAALCGRRTLALVMAVLAPFAHETGVLVAPLLALWMLTAEGERPPWRAVLRDTAPYWAVAVGGLAVWLLAPKDVGETWILNLESRWQNAAYFAQGLAFPVAPLARTVMARSARLNDLQAIAVVAAPAVALWAALLWRAGRARDVALALGWYAVAIGPAWLVLGFAYVVDGPRLMYGASAGAALLWAAPLGLLAERRRARRALGAAGVVAVLAGAYVGGRFLHSRADLYRQMGHAVEGLVRAAEGVPAGGRLVVLNAPWWIAPQETAFALGHEGVTLVPPYTSTGDLLWLHTGVEREVQALIVPALRQDWRYWYTCDGVEVGPEDLAEGLRRADAVALVDYGGRDIRVQEVGARLPEAAEESGWLAEYGGVRLADVRVEGAPEGLRVELVWSCSRPPEEDLTVFLHVVDGAGVLVGQRDGYPLAGASPPRTWQPGEAWRDARYVPLETGAEPAALGVGLYRVGDGARVEGRDAQGVRLADDALVMPLPVAAAEAVE